MALTTSLQSSLVPVLRQDCLQRQERAQLYKTLAKSETCPRKRDLYWALATHTEQGLLRPARRLHRLGESVPAFQPGWQHQLKRWWFGHVKAHWGLTLLQRAEAKNARRYLDVLQDVMPVGDPAGTKVHQQNNGLGDAKIRQQRLSPPLGNPGPSQPQQGSLSQALQDFAHRASLTCALETGGKISPSEAMERLDSLWQNLEAAHMRHRLIHLLADPQEGMES